MTTYKTPAGAGPSSNTPAGTGPPRKTPAGAGPPSNTPAGTGPRSNTHSLIQSIINPRCPVKPGQHAFPDTSKQSLILSLGLLVHDLWH